MTVSELIAFLAQMPGDAPVMVMGKGVFCTPAERVRWMRNAAGTDEACIEITVPDGGDDVA